MHHIFFTNKVLFYFMIAHWIEFFFLLYFLFVNGFYVLLYFCSILPFYRRFKEAQSEPFTRLLSSDSAPPISVVIPAYNENYTLVRVIQSVFNVRYRHVDVIAVNDGSTDETLEILKKEFQLVAAPVTSRPILKTQQVKAYYRSAKYPNLLIVDKVRGGRGDALNSGINACTTPYFLAIDSDTYLEPDVCQRMMRRVLTQPDIVAAAGMLRVANGCEFNKGTVTKVHFPKSYLAGMQVLDYLRTFSYGRMGWTPLGGQYNISGGFGLFKREAVLAVGGFHIILAEDMDMTLRLHEYYRINKKPYQIDYIPDGTAWTEVPFTYRDLSKQRERWQRAMPEIMLKMKKMLFNPKYGPIGFIQIPFLIFGEFLSPVVEMLGYIYIILAAIIGVLNLQFFWLFVLFAWGVNILLSIFAILMEESSLRRYKSPSDLFKIIGFAFLEIFGYRQLTVIWRIRGIFNYFRKKGAVWEKGKRLQFSQSKT